MVVARMVPAVPPDAGAASTGVNRVLREQITGIRVVRAFVREPDEVERFDGGQRRPHRHVAAAPAGSWRACSRS